MSAIGLRRVVFIFAILSFLGAVALAFWSWKISYTAHVGAYTEFRQLYNSKAIVVDNAKVREVGATWELEGWHFSLDNWDTVFNIIERNFMAASIVWQVTAAALFLQSIVLGVIWIASRKLAVRT